MFQIHLWYNCILFYGIQSHLFLSYRTFIMQRVQIIIAGSLVRPKVVRSVHYCPATKKTLERRYTDLTSYDAFPSSALYPTKDDDG